MKARILIVCLGLGLSILFFVMGSRRSRPEPLPTTKSIPGLPTMPDLRRWPQEMRDLVATSYRAIGDPAESTKALRELAQVYYANGFIPEATQTLQALLLADPENGRWPYLLGLLEERTDNRVAAEASFASAARLAPTYVPALFHRTNLLAISGQFAVARRLFEQCVVIDPADPRAALGLAKLEFAQSNEPAAIERLWLLVQQHPEFPDAHLMLADLLAKSGDMRRAAEQRTFLIAGQSAPPDKDPYVDETYRYCYDSRRLQALGQIRNATQDYDTALLYLRRAVQIDPVNEEMYEALAQAHIGLKQWTEAQSTLQLALQRAGPSDMIYSRLAEVLLAQKKGDEAINLLLSAQNERPATALQKNALGSTYLALNRIPEAIEAFSAAVKLDPIFADSQFSLTRCYLAAGNFPAAREWVERALKLRPESIEGLAMLTAANLQSNDIDAAINSARELALRGGHKAEYKAIYAAVQLRAGNRSAERGEHAKAEQFYREGLSVDERNGQLHGALGMLYGKLHHNAQAKAEFELFRQIEPRNPLGFILLGAAFQAENKPEEARRTWNAGLEIAIETKDSTRITQLQQLLGIGKQ